MLCFQTESFKLSQPYSQCTEDGSDVPVQNIYDAVYSLQVRAGGDGQAWAAAWTQGARPHAGRGVSGARCVWARILGVRPDTSVTDGAGWFQSPSARL